MSQPSNQDTEGDKTIEAQKVELGIDDILRTWLALYKLDPSHVKILNDKIIQKFSGNGRK